MNSLSKRKEKTVMVKNYPLALGHQEQLMQRYAGHTSSLMLSHHGNANQLRGTALQSTTLLTFYTVCY